MQVYISFSSTYRSQVQRCGHYRRGTNSNNTAQRAFWDNLIRPFGGSSASAFGDTYLTHVASLKAVLFGALSWSTGWASGGPQGFLQHSLHGETWGPSALKMGGQLAYWRALRCPGALFYTRYNINLQPDIVRAFCPAMSRSLRQFRSTALSQTMLGVPNQTMQGAPQLGHYKGKGPSPGHVKGPSSGLVQGPPSQHPGPGITFQGPEQFLMFNTKRHL